MNRGERFFGGFLAATLLLSTGSACKENPSKTLMQQGIRKTVESISITSLSQRYNVILDDRKLKELAKDCSVRGYPIEAIISDTPLQPGAPGQIYVPTENPQAETNAILAGGVCLVIDPDNRKKIQEAARKYSSDNNQILELTPKGRTF